MKTTWIKNATEAGEYASADGKLKAIRAFNRAYGNGSWNLHGLAKPHVFRTFAELKKFVDAQK